MTLAQIYNELIEIMRDNMNFQKALKLKEKLVEIMLDIPLDDILINMIFKEIEKAKLKVEETEKEFLILATDNDISKKDFLKLYGYPSYN